MLLNKDANINDITLDNKIKIKNMLTTKKVSSIRSSSANKNYQKPTKLKIFDPYTSNRVLYVSEKNEKKNEKKKNIIFIY